MLSPLTEFALLARMPDEALDLEALTASVARMGDPGVSAVQLGIQLDQLAHDVVDQVDPGAPPDRLARQLRAALVGRLGFTGDLARFDEVRGSYLDAVLTLRRGLPILLSIVWMCVGRRLGVEVGGVSFPGRFLVCVGDRSARIYLDPFDGGAVVGVGELLGSLGPDRRERVLLEPVGPRPIITRVLVNLKMRFMDARDAAALVEVSNRLLLIAGERAEELRDRGMALLQLGKNVEGAADLQRYLKLRPDALDRAAVEALLVRHRS